MFENLIGAQIVSMDESSIKIKINEEIHVLEILSDGGDCCGYANFKANLLYAEGNIRNPIITNVELNHTEDGYDSDCSVFTFYGENKELATIESEAGSGSGWSYGAVVTLRCKTLGINEDLASW